MKTWHIDYKAVRSELRKLGVILISGGIIGRAFDNKISTLTATLAILIGIVWLAFGSIYKSEASTEDINHD